MEMARLNLVNRVQFRAQMYEEEAVDLVRAMMYADEAPMGHRLQCAQQIVQWARGSVKTWNHDGETINPAAPGPAGLPVGETIEAARAAVEVFSRFDRNVRLNIPYADWDDEVKALAEAAAFAEVAEADEADEAEAAD